MTVEFRAMVNAYRNRVRVGPRLGAAADIRRDRDYAELDRTKASHQGIGTHQQLRQLAAIDVNQDYLEEIGQLRGLTHLDLRWPMRAKDLSPLRALHDLQVLHLESASGIEDLSPLAELPSLKVLTVENAPKVRTLEWARPLKNRLSVFGYEGTINKDQIVTDLAPLEGFAIEAFFCTSLSNQSKDIGVFETCLNLKLIDGAVLAPWKSYRALHEVRPEIVCTWFDPRAWFVGWRDGPSAAEREKAAIADR